MAALIALGSVPGLALAQAAGTAPAGGAADAPAPKDDGTRLGTILIIGQGDKLGAGQMLNEDAAKGRSTITRSATEKDRTTGNFYQAMSLLPGMNTFSHDATGLFGGGLTVRGFNSDQLGVTINGAPINDSGNFAVYPMEYTDQENLCTQSIAQGAPDVESPHVGSTGGSVGLTSCDPEDKQRTRMSQTLGMLNLRRSFIRLDTGRFADDKAKVFVSLSQTQADKWRGPGSANRKHMDAAFSWDLTPDNRILGSVLYNKALNNNFYTMSLAQINTLGYKADYNSVFPGHKSPTPGVADVDPATSSGNPASIYYQLSQNPFENVIASLSGSFKLNNDVILKVQPYLWYGYGTGGTQQRTFSETGFLNTATGKLGAGVDLNGDGDTKDTVIVANSSVTRTMRPGVTTEVNWFLGDHTVRAGIWYERASHRQTGPFVPVDATGNAYDIWLEKNNVLRPDGSTAQSRDWLTVSTAHQLYANDTWNLNKNTVLTFGLRAPQVTRDFTNKASEAGGNSLNSYNLVKSFSDVLPQAGIRMNLDKSSQVFLNAAKNFRAPPNFALAPNNNNVTFPNGVATLTGAVEAETSVVTDLGYRYQVREFSVSLTGFNVDFKNRQANAFDPNTQLNIYTNAGNVRNRGLEAELGTAVYSGFSAYASFTAQNSEILGDLPGTVKGAVLPTKGKQFPLTPSRMAATALQYQAAGFYARVKVKRTGEQWATLVNDELVPAYTLVDFDAGYRFGDVGIARNAVVRFNVSNATDQQYRNPTGSTTNAVTVGGQSASSPFYYLGAPRFTSVSLSADF